MMSENGPLERALFWVIDKLKYLNIEWWLRERTPNAQMFGANVRTSDSNVRSPDTNVPAEGVKK